MFVALIVSGCTGTPKDSDGDGWSDEQEIKAGTDSNLKDTDGDGIWDPKDDNPLDKNIPVKQTMQTPSQTPISTPIITSNPIPSPTPSMSIDKIKKNAVGVKYDDLMRNNEKYIDKIIYYKGEVAQVSEVSKNEYVLRISVTQTEYYWNDVIWVNYHGSRLLDKDIVDVWGKVTGLKTYTAVMGNEITIPEMEALNIELVTKAGDQ